MKKTAQKTVTETTKRNIFALTPNDLKAITGGRGVVVQVDSDANTAK